MSFCQSRGLKKLIRADWDFSPIREGCFDVVVASDFIEHLDDDVSAVKKMYSTLKKGGLLLITVPAYPWMFSSHDLALNHKRRYSRAMLENLLKCAGVSEVKLFYWGGMLFPFMFPVRITQKVLLKKRNNEGKYETIKYELPRFLNDFFMWLLDFELRRIKENKPMKVGSSLVAIAVKR